PPGSRHGGGDHLLRLFVDGRLRVSSQDEERYHEALVHPAFAHGPRGRVLVLGDGDGLALREILGYREVTAVTVVAPDRDLVELARTDPVLARMNERAFEDPRVRTVAADAFHRLRSRAPVTRPYDVIVSDLPGPEEEPTRLYSEEFYGLLSRSLAPAGRLAVHAGTPDLRAHDFWTVEATLRAAGLATTPYTVDGRVSGHAASVGTGADEEGGGATRHWGFVLAVHGGVSPSVRTAPPGDRPALSALSGSCLSAAVARAREGRLTGLPSSTLMHPRYRE
ncbi:hypothetical protein N566_12215, partial [Streptomycetaceae bacterium MP113-05]